MCTNVPVSRRIGIDALDLAATVMDAFLFKNDLLLKKPNTDGWIYKITCREPV